jgi:hypothetical protein
LLVLALANGLNGLALSGLGEVLPTLHRTWHAGYDGLGLALGLLRCASFLGALCIGPSIDRLPVTPVGPLMGHGRLAATTQLIAASLIMAPLAGLALGTPARARALRATTPE